VWGFECKLRWIWGMCCVWFHWLDENEDFWDWIFLGSSLCEVICTES